MPVQGIAAALQTVARCGRAVAKRAADFFSLGSSDSERVGRKLGIRQDHSTQSDHVDPTGAPNYNAQVFVFFIITVAAAEVAVGLAIIVALYRARQTTHVEDINTLKF